MTNDRPRPILPTLHNAQQEIRDGAARFNVLNCGRRFGKDVLLMDAGIETALASYPVGWFNPSYPMLTEVWAMLKALLHPVLARVDTQQHRLELVTGGVIDLWSLDAFNSARGRKYRRVIINEAAMVPHLQEAWEQAIRPTLTDYEGDAWFGSTPKGRNYFFNLYQRGLDELQTEWRSWHKPTSDNPFIPTREIDAARDELPSQVFMQEYLAEFLEGEGAVFRNILPNLTAPPNATPDQHQGHYMVMGADWAQKHDFTVLSVGCQTCKVEVALDRFNQIEWAFQRDRFQTLYSRWGVKHAEAEANSIGSPNIEALQKLKMNVVPFDTTSASKRPLIQSLVLCFERNECKWLNVPVATGELEAYESKINANTGHVSYGAPEGVHDDTIIARALCWKAMNEGSLGVFL